MLLVGLTGNMGAGKSTVARLLHAHGATLIDADVLARAAVEVGTAAYRAIVARWGEQVLTPDRTLDRAALRALVFHDHAELEALNEIVHPEVARLRDEALNAARARGDQVVVCDIPLLFERNLVADFDVIVLVDAPRDVRLERVVKARGIPEADAMAMIASQMPAELKRARADYVLDNVDTPAALAEQVETMWVDLARRAAGATGAAGVAPANVT